MASVRSVNLSKPPERLLKRRSTRTSASTSNLSSARKPSVAKATSVTVSTLHRRKSTRTLSKKRSHKTTNSPTRKNSLSSTTDQDLNELTTKLENTEITTLPTIRSVQRFSVSTAATAPDLSPVVSVMDERISLKSTLSDHPAESIASVQLPPISPRKSIEDQRVQFNIDSFDFLRTIGTGTFGRVQLVLHSSTNTYYALKMMSIKRIVELKQVEHVHNEKRVLSMVNHPFLVHLEWTTHTDTTLFLLFEYLPGGELFRLMRKHDKFDSKTAVFYASEVLLAVDYLHHHDIVFRDLKPENILLDSEGHIRLVDFGFAKQTKERTYTMCGTADYLAPEVIQNRGHHKASDWWALGILIFEMLAGFPPFFDNDQLEIYRKIVAGKLEFPRHFDYASKQIVRKLLNTDQSQRLGSAKDGGDEIKREPWFVAVSWDDLLAKRVDPPIKPTISSPGDCNNFETYEEFDAKLNQAAPKYEVQLFKDF